MPLTSQSCCMQIPQPRSCSHHKSNITQEPNLETSAASLWAAMHNMPASHVVVPCISLASASRVASRKSKEVSDTDTTRVIYSSEPRSCFDSRRKVETKHWEIHGMFVLSIFQRPVPARYFLYRLIVGMGKFKRDKRYRD